MAEPEDHDEDLFADLYDGDDVAEKPAEAAPRQAAPIPTAEPDPPEPINSFNTDAQDSFMVDSAAAGHDGYDMGAGDDADWNGAQDAENSHAGGNDNYGPIGIKEDG